MPTVERMGMSVCCACLVHNFWCAVCTCVHRNGNMLTECVCHVSCAWPLCLQFSVSLRWVLRVLRPWVWVSCVLGGV